MKVCSVLGRTEFSMNFIAGVLPTRYIYIYNTLLTCPFSNFGGTFQKAVLAIWVPIGLPVFVFSRRTAQARTSEESRGNAWNFLLRCEIFKAAQQPQPRFPPIFVRFWRLVGVALGFGLEIGLGRLRRAAVLSSRQGVPSSRPPVSVF